jgi:hypothetical protein
MQACISEPACLPHSFLASFLQSCDTELLEEDDAGAEAGGGVAVCAQTAHETPKESVSNRLFIFIPSRIAKLPEGTSLAGRFAPLSQRRSALLPTER